MLREIHIQNYAVIDNLSVEFGAGLNLLSGETGSGKSILVDALGLALGGRTSAEVIRTGEDRASVTAVFSAEGKAPWVAWLEDYGVAPGDKEELILRRELQAGGKSRMLVNDQPVTLAAVRVLAQHLVEMHGQNEHVSLFAREAQRSLLDQFAGTGSELEGVRALHGRRRELEHELDELSHNEQERLRTLDLLGFQVRELEQARLEPGEDAHLEQERKVLSNLEKIRAAAGGAFAELYEDEGAAISRVAAASRQLEELRRYDAGVATQIEPLVAARATLEDVAAFLRDYVGRLEANPARLDEIEDRLALIDRLKRKYGSSVEEILGYADEVRQKLATLEHADERREAVRKDLAKVSGEYRRAAEALSEKRREAAPTDGQAGARGTGAALGMEKTRMEIHFESAAEGQGGATGIDEVEFRVSPNVGEELRAMEKIASGGEISRKRHFLELGSVDACLAAVHGIPISSAATYILGDPARAVVVEWMPSGTAMFAGDRLGHTNHIVDPALRHLERYLPALPDSVDRLARVGELLHDTDGSLAGMQAMLSDHVGHPASICRHGGAGDLHTLASVIFEPSRRRMHVAYGTPCATPYWTYALDGTVHPASVGRSAAR